jgi:hypothetical protein
MAGDDVKALEAFARYKDEGELGKAFLEQRSALSKKSEPLRLVDNATPQQIAEYRKGLGVPEIAADAKADAYLEAYKIAPPDGYAMDPLQKSMIEGFAKQAYDSGASPREVKLATDYFFKTQADGVKAMDQLHATKQKEWSQALKDEWGRDYDGQFAAADSYFQQAFSEDERAALVAAELPGGGKLGANPTFIKMLNDLARQNGFTDRIETTAMEAGGKSLEQQQLDLENLRMTNRALYNEAATQDRLTKIIDLRLKRGEIDESGNPVRKRRAG